MRKYLYIQLVFFLILFFAGTLLTYFNLNKIKDTLLYVVNASESMRVRDTLFQDVELFSKSPTVANLSSIRDTLKKCDKCHHHEEELEKINSIKQLSNLLKADSDNKALIERLHELTFEAATAGKELVVTRSRIAIKKSNSLFLCFFGTTGILLVLFGIFNYFVFNRAERNLNKVIDATRAVSEGKKIKKDYFSGEFLEIGNAFERLQQELKIKEEKLINWSRQWQLAFDSIDEMMCLCDRNGLVVLANRSFKEFFADSFEGKSIYDILCKHFSCEDDCTVRDALREGKARETTLTGNGLILSVKVYPLHDEKAETTGFIWVGRDITKERELEERAFQSEKLVALGELVAGIAHEINNPLSVVVGYSEIMLQNNQLDERDRKRLDKIFQSATRAANIISNLLDFARKRVPEQTVLNLNSISDQILDLVAYELRSDGIKLVKEYDPQLPSILGDKTQVGQVLLNLLKNAHDAVAEVSPPREITVRTYHDDRHVYIDIIDNGTGIPEENLSRVFEPFFTTKDVGKGTGLGLSITYSIVKAHGGDIIIKNRPEGGIIVKISFPRGDTA